MEISLKQKNLIIGCENKMKAYKLTSLDKKSYVIRTINAKLKTGGKYCLNYSKGRRTKMVPGTIGVMCFDTIDRAIEFAYVLGGDYILWEVEGYNQLPKPKNIANTLFSNEITNYYKYNGKYNISYVKTGTLFFESIKLIKEIKRKEF